MLFAVDTSLWPMLSTIAFVVLAVFALIIFALFANYFRLWMQSFMTGANIGILDLVGMTFRKVPPSTIVRAKVMATQAGLTDAQGVTSSALEAHVLAGGHISEVIRALVAAQKAKTIDLPFKLATAIDLAGRDVLEAVRTSVYPKVIDCPGRVGSRETLDAVAKNGVQLKVKARVTVRTSIKQLIGGAGEETIIARVGEGIVSAIGAADSHLDVLENPDRISKAVLARRLDSQTAFEIVSIDIADIDVGDNIGARLQADQAEADMRVARANAEGRRAMAVAQEQEMIAKMEEGRATVVESEAQVPKAIASAIREQTMGVMDYFKLRNLQADTDMRRSIAGLPAAK